MSPVINWKKNKSKVNKFEFIFTFLDVVSRIGQFIDS